MPEANQETSVSKPIEGIMNSALLGPLAIVFGFALISSDIVLVLLRPLTYTTVVFGATGLLFLIAGFAILTQAEKKAEQAERDKVRAQLDKSGPDRYFQDLVTVNVDNLSAYYVTVKRHANRSFLASLFVSIAGFVLIGIGVHSALGNQQQSLSVTTLTGVSGVATEFISAIFFYLYSQTVRQMKEYHDSLIAVQNILLSFKLVGDTADPIEKNKMTKTMLQYLVGGSVNPIPDFDSERT